MLTRGQLIVFLEKSINENGNHYISDAGISIKI